MKFLALTAVALTLTACGGSTAGPVVSKMSNEVAASGPVCPNSPHLQSAFGLPVRCGPQTETPYTLN